MSRLATVLLAVALALPVAGCGEQASPPEVRTAPSGEEYAAADAAFAADRPTVLDVRCDPDVPPIPPHATFAQIKSVAGAVLHGDEDTWGFVKQGIKQKAQQYLPGHKDPR